MQNHDMQNHIVKTFDVEIAQLKETLMDMAQKCENQLEKTAQAIKLWDNTLAGKVIKNDREINEDQFRIENLAVSFLARRQPLAVDLRHLLCMMKMASGLERIGDYTANAAKRITRLSHFPAGDPQNLIITMANIGRIMLHDAVLAFLMLDMEKAMDVWKKDDEMDEAFIQINNRIQQQMETGKSQIDDGTHLLFIGKCFERIGDHITNITEDIYYIVSGNNFTGRFETS